MVQNGAIMSPKEQVVFGLELLLDYAKYLEDSGHLSYDLLRQRVETFKGVSDERTL